MLRNTRLAFAFIVWRACLQGLGDVVLDCAREGTEFQRFQFINRNMFSTVDFVVLEDKKRVVVKSNVLTENRAWLESFRLGADRFIHVHIARASKSFQFGKQVLNVTVVDEFVRTFDAVTRHQVVHKCTVCSCTCPEDMRSPVVCHRTSNRGSDCANGSLRARVLSADSWS